MPRADLTVAQTTGVLQFTGGGHSYVVHANNGASYLFFVDTGSDLAFKKSVDGGLTWSLPTVILAGTIVSFAVWYDRWSGLSADLIHLAYTDGADSDTKYRTVNTASADALSTQTVIFAGTSSAGGGSLTIARSRGGNVYCRTTIDAGVEGGFFRLPNANVPNGAWDAAKTNPEALATTDQAILAPGFAADNQDMLMIFWDASANQVSRYIYDDSANTWAETLFGGTQTDALASASYPHFNVAVDLANSLLIVCAWNAIDAANQDLNCWTVTESAITAKTDVVANATDDCGLVGVSLDTVTGYWYVVWAGKTDGSETWSTAVNLYYSMSTDGGTTWTTPTKLTTTTYSLAWLATCPRISSPTQFEVAFHNDSTLDQIMYNAALPVFSRTPGAMQ